MHAGETSQSVIITIVNNTATDGDTIAITRLTAFILIDNKFIMAVARGMAIRISDLSVTRNQKGHDEPDERETFKTSCNTLWINSKNGTINNKRESVADFLALRIGNLNFACSCKWGDWEPLIYSELFV